MTAKILVVEDDELLNRLVSKQLRGFGYEVTGAVSWAEADTYLADNEPTLIVTDARLPDGDSLERLPDLVDTYPVVILTAYGSVRDAVAAMKNGAVDYLLKPVSPDELQLTVERTLENAALRNDHQFCKRQLHAREAAGKDLLGSS